MAACPRVLALSTTALEAFANPPFSVAVAVLVGDGETNGNWQLKGLGLFNQLLNIVLAKVPVTSGVRCLHKLGAVELADCDQPGALHEPRLRHLSINAGIYTR